MTTGFYPECEKEPIHLIGKIQNSGCLVGGDINSELISFCSQNAINYFPNHQGELLGSNVFELLPHLKQALSNRHNSRQLLCGIIQHGNLVQDGVYFENSNNWLLEIFDTSSNADTHDSIIYEYQKQFLNYPLEQLNSETYNQRLIEAVHNILGYEHIMLYQFLYDGTGEVIAEVSSPDHDDYLGLRFPASDIPKTARKLYERTPYRCIPSTELATSDLVSQGSRDNIDLSDSVLRAVAPVHLEYLENMQVKASISFSITHKGKLWGLVACHSRTPKPYSLRNTEACSMLVNAYSTYLMLNDTETQLENSEIAETHVNKISDLINQYSSHWLEIPEVIDYIMSMMDASGFIYKDSNGTHAYGKTPPKPDTVEMLEFLINAYSPHELISIDNLSFAYPLAAQFNDIASGLLFLVLSDKESANKKWIAWFRPEQSKIVNWAGNPKKSHIEDFHANASLRPRSSFKKWQQEHKAISHPWTDLERTIASRIKLLMLIDKYI